MANSVKSIIKAIGSEHLALYRGQGRDDYWYFVYDNVTTGQYDTHSVMTMRLNDLTADEWVAEGKAFVATFEAPESPEVPHLVDNATGERVTLPWTTKDFRGDDVTVVSFIVPRHGGSTGRIVTSEGAEYYPGVVNARIAGF